MATYGLTATTVHSATLRVEESNGVKKWDTTSFSNFEKYPESYESWEILNAFDKLCPYNFRDEMKNYLKESRRCKFKEAPLSTIY